MLPGEKKYLVDNHNSVLKIWDQYNVCQCTCIHLDAHLDCSWTAKEGKERFLSSENHSDWFDSEERDSFLYQYEGSIDISNWLNFAIQVGYVSKLYWVVPDGIWFSSPASFMALLEKQTGMISVNSFTNIPAQRGPYLFELNHCTVIVCKLNDLPEFNENDRVLLDIDLDFFSNYKKTASIDDLRYPCFSLENFRRSLNKSVPHPIITSVCFSQNGGYASVDLTEKLDSLYRDFDAFPSERDLQATLPAMKGSYLDYTNSCALLHRGNFVGAEILAKKAVNENPEIGAYHYALALAYLQVGKIDNALSSIESCLTLPFSESAQIFNDAAHIYLLNGAQKAGEELQQLAFSTDESDNPIISRNYMALAISQGDIEKAEELAVITLSRQPYNNDAWSTLSMCMLKKKMFSNAQFALEQSINTCMNDKKRSVFRNQLRRLKGGE